MVVSPFERMRLLAIRLLRLQDVCYALKSEQGWRSKLRFNYSTCSVETKKMADSDNT